MSTKFHYAEIAKSAGIAKRESRSSYCVLCGLCALCDLCAFAASPSFAQDKPIAFDRDIRPILSENCFKCHGFDEKARKAKLRLDVRDAAIAKKAFIPNDPANSELIKRITTTDPDDHMPPPDSGKKLTPHQIELLKTWIANGMFVTVEGLDHNRQTRTFVEVGTLACSTSDET